MQNDRYDHHARPTPANPPDPGQTNGHDGGWKRSTPPLSPTERRVYDLLMQRLTERQVAEKLGRSHNTVHVHVRNIYRKLGCRTRQELFDLPLQAIRAQRRNP